MNNRARSAARRNAIRQTGEYYASYYSAADRAICALRGVPGTKVSDNDGRRGVVNMRGNNVGEILVDWVDGEQTWTSVHEVERAS